MDDALPAASGWLEPRHKPGAQTEETLERYIVHVIESTRLIVVPPVETGVSSLAG